jgi:pyruvate formate lyase activating enzyme
VHFTRYQPDYLLKNLPPTPAATLDRAKAIADAEGLRFVYVGNVPGHPAEKTYCPNCHRVVVDRTGYQIDASRAAKGRCRYCQQPIPGVWS